MEQDIKKKIENKLSQLNGQLGENTRYSELLRIAQLYNREDRVVSSEDLKEELENQPRSDFNLKSEIPKLDDIIGGFREGQLVVISAPTGMGKTSFAQTLTTNFSTNCLWFSYEVGMEEFMDKFNGSPLFYLPRRLKQNSIDWLEKRIIESIAKFDCKVVFIDHLHYLLEMQKMAQAKSISLLVGMMMRELKKIAITHNIVIFLISHMRKLLYDKLPEIDDLRDSSFIGQESDVVIFLKRLKEKENGEEVPTNYTTLKVAKNRRTGKLGNVKLVMNNKKFEEVYV